MPPPPVTRGALLQLYKQLLRSCQTYPSKNRTGIYQAIREEWRDHKDQKDEAKLNRQITVAYKGLSQLRQFGMFGKRTKLSSEIVKVDATLVCARANRGVHRLSIHRPQKRTKLASC